MDRMQVYGVPELCGSINISGAKNSALPIMIASLLSSGIVNLSNIPDILDVRSLKYIISLLGCDISLSKGVFSIDSSCTESVPVSKDRISTIRASILIFGVLLAKHGHASIYLPGGCKIGARPIDLHCAGLKMMGCDIKADGDLIQGRVLGSRLVGAHINMPKSSVGATQNILMAATLANGRTVIENAAMEPEVSDLANFLCSMGANIDGIGTRKIVIDGVDYLSGCDYSILPDRIEAATYAIAAGIVSGAIRIKGANSLHLSSVFDILSKCGIEIKESDNGDILVSSDGILDGFDIVTGPYPGIPTDLQPLLMVLAAVARSSSSIVETIFENRFLHVPGMRKMGCAIKLKKDLATISGSRERLIGDSEVACTDIRGGAALVLLSMAAPGITTVTRLNHIHRGYESMIEKLCSCGARISYPRSSFGHSRVVL